MQVRTLGDETDMGDVESGMTSRVTVEAYPGRPFVGLVEKIEPQAVVEQSVTMFPVIVQLDNQSGLLKPGMNAEVEILINEAPGVHLIPNNAVVTPQDAAAAASILGLQDIDIRSLFSNRAGRGGGRAQGERGARPGNSEAEPGNTNRPRGPVGAEVDSLRSKVQRGEISQDSGVEPDVWPANDCISVPFTRISSLVGKLRVSPVPTIQIDTVVFTEPPVLLAQMVYVVLAETSRGVP